MATSIHRISSHFLEAAGVSDADADADFGVEASYSPLEWLVIAIARRDSISSARQPGRLAAALGSLFGSASHASLADPRLEALRHAAVLAWHLREPDADERVRFSDAGFSAAHRRLLTASIARDLGLTPRPANDRGSAYPGRHQGAALAH